MEEKETIFERADGTPVKLIFHQHQSPGDVVVFTAALRDLHKAFPGKFLTDVRTSCDELFEHNEFVTKLDDKADDVHALKAEYSLIHESNEGPYHFTEAFHRDIGRALGIHIPPTKMRGHVPLSDEEKSWYSQIREILGKDVPYWLIDAGCKPDYTAKQWAFSRYQAVVDALPDIWFVQIGKKEHMHRELQGDNVINLLDKTDNRQFVRLMYHAAGVITPVSFPMHLAAAVEMKPELRHKTRPCIVIAGGREPNQWEAYVNHQYLHTCGQLPCCDNGGCWKSRTEKLKTQSKHNKSLCVDPVKTAEGETIPHCMDMITVDDVVKHVRRYLEAYDYVTMFD